MNNNEIFPKKVEDLSTTTVDNSSIDKLDWRGMDSIQSEMKSIFESINRNLNQIKGMTEIAKDRNFIPSQEGQDKAQEIIKKFQPYGEYMKPLYNMIGDLADVSSLMFKEGLLVKQDELNKKLEEIKDRK
jgi:hypothetical protein